MKIQKYLEKHCFNLLTLFLIIVSALYLCFECYIAAETNTFDLMFEPLAYLALPWIGYGIIYVLKFKKKKERRALLSILIILGVLLLLFISGALVPILAPFYAFKSL